MIQIAQNKKTGRKVIVMSRFPYMFHVIHVALLRSCRCAAVKPASSTDPSLPLCHYGVSGRLVGQCGRGGQVGGWGARGPRRPPVEPARTGA